MASPATIYCPVRKSWVAALPEEIVRQQLVANMVQLGYPLANLVIEKGLRQMPHLQLKGVKIPTRRADIICFAKGIHPHYDLFPLLLVECKAVKIDAKVINQVVGYNHFLQARFIAVANQTEQRTGWYDVSTKGYTFIDWLPSYDELMQNSPQSRTVV